MADSTRTATVAQRPAPVLPDVADTDGLPGDTGCIDLDDAAVAVGEWVDRVLSGDRVLILRAGQATTQLMPVRRKPGGW